MKQLLLILLSLFTLVFTTYANKIDDSVVKIYVTSSSYNYYEPWILNSQSKSSGSGFVIKGNKIMTNAHVVADAKYIQVKKSTSSKKYIGKIEVVAHEADLAIITVEDKSFFDDAPALSFENQIHTREKVEVYGYPIGGDKLSITEGVISRIEQRTYAHSGAKLLASQIDAAINHGNSGGPVLKNGKVVGVAFQSAGKGENLGYIIPLDIIKHFLTDIQDGSYNGFPELPIEIMPMESNSLKEYYSLPKDKSGVLVRFIDPKSTTIKHIKKGDIILSINGYTIYDDATIKHGDDSYDLSYLVQKYQIGEKLTLTIFRDKNKINITIPLKDRIQSSRLVPTEQYDTKPEYYINGGLIFTKLTKNYIQEWGSKWYYTAPTPLLYQYFYGRKEVNRESVIVLSKVLPDDVNMGYHDISNRIIHKVNGKEISSIEELVKAVENNKSEFTIFESDNLIIVLNREDVEQSNERIKDKFNIPSIKNLRN